VWIAEMAASGDAERKKACSILFKYATDEAIQAWFQEGGPSKWVVPEGLPASRFILELVWRVVSTLHYKARLT
jgi:hypothetical protein